MSVKMKEEETKTAGRKPNRWTAVTLEEILVFLAESDTLNQSTFAKAVGVTPTTFYNWKKKRCAPDTTTQERMRELIYSTGFKFTKTSTKETTVANSGKKGARGTSSSILDRITKSSGPKSRAKSKAKQAKPAKAKQAKPAKPAKPAKKAKPVKEAKAADSAKAKRGPGRPRKAVAAALEAPKRRGRPPGSKNKPKAAVPAKKSPPKKPAARKPRRASTNGTGNGGLDLGWAELGSLVTFLKANQGRSTDDLAQIAGFVEAVISA